MAPSNQQRKEKRVTDPTPPQPPQQRPLKDMRVSELKARLKKKGLPVTGKKADLIEMLEEYPDGLGTTPKKWQYSVGKKLLKKQLLDTESPIHNMSVKDIKNSNPLYKQYPNFRKYYEDLKRQVEAEKKQAHLDDIAVERHIKNNPRSSLNRRGYPHWNGSPAEKLLRIDVYKKLHETMKPSELRMTRREYQKFPPAVFTKRVNREAEKQRLAKFWAYKRNKENLKQYLKNIEERARA